MTVIYYFENNKIDVFDELAAFSRSISLLSPVITLTCKLTYDAYHARLIRYFNR